MEEMEELKKEKEKIEKKIKLLKVSELKKRNGNGVPNILVRISTRFNQEIDEIIQKRRENISKPKTTELIIRHKLWNKIKEDLMNFDLEEEEKYIKNEK